MLLLTITTGPRVYLNSAHIATLHESDEEGPHDECHAIAMDGTRHRLAINELAPYGGIPELVAMINAG